jgi:SHS2 domain-containing protein
MSNSFEILDHPADMGFQVIGKSEIDLFIYSAIALTHVLVDLESIECKETKIIKLEGFDLESLLYNWLSEIIFEFDGEGKVYNQFEVLKLTNTNNTFYLEAKLQGEKYVPNKHVIKTYVKAITYHQLSINKTTTGYIAKVFLDI